MINGWSVSFSLLFDAYPCQMDRESKLVRILRVVNQLVYWLVSHQQLPGFVSRKIWLRSLVMFIRWCKICNHNQISRHTHNHLLGIAWNNQNMLLVAVGISYCRRCFIIKQSWLLWLATGWLLMNSTNHGYPGTTMSTQDWINSTQNGAAAQAVWWRWFWWVNHRSLSGFGFIGSIMIYQLSI